MYGYVWNTYFHLKNEDFFPVEKYSGWSLHTRGGEHHPGNKKQNIMFTTRREQDNQFIPF